MKTSSSVPGTAALCLTAVLLALSRAAVFHFNSKFIPVPDGLLFALAGLGGDLGPLWLCLLAAVLLRSRLCAVLGTLYLMAVTALDLFNAGAMYQARLIFSYDLFLQIRNNTAVYRLEIAVACGLLLLLGLCNGCGLLRLARAPRRLAVPCLCVLLLLSAAATAGYELTKDSIFFKGYGTREWVLRPFHTAMLDFFRDREARLAARNASIHAQPQDGPTLATASRLLADPGTVRRFDAIVIVALESIDLAYLHGKNPDIPAVATRNLDALAREHVLFDNFFTAAQPTSRGLHALMASRLDYEADPPAATPSIFTAFAGAGYDTWFISTISGQWGDARSDITHRYQPAHVIFGEELSRKYGARVLKWGLDSALGFREAADILAGRKAGDRSVLFISTIDTHPNYGFVPPEGDACWRDGTVTASPFLLSLCHIDRAGGDFIRDLRQRGSKTEKAIVVLTADHSAVQGANYTRRAAYAPDRIPLLFITGDGGILREWSTAYASQIDLPATLLTLSGILPPATFMGQDMRRPGSRAISVHDGVLEARDAAGTERISPRRQPAHPLSRWFSIFYPAETGATRR